VEPTSVVVIDQSRMFRGQRSVVLERIVQAVQLQVERDFAPAWGRQPVSVKLADANVHIAPGAGRVYVVDKITEVGGAVGFHKADKQGFFSGFVAAEAIARLGGAATRGGDSVSAAVSHEVLEILANPSVNLWADHVDGKSYAHEVCDPVSGDCYEIHGEPDPDGVQEPVSVSNFVYPAWFQPYAPGGSKFDHLGLLCSAFTHRSTGYVSVFETSGARHLFGAEVPASKRDAKSSSGRCARAHLAMIGCSRET